MVKFLRKFFKIVVGLFVLALVLFGILYIIYNEPMPTGRKGPAADQLAQKMLEAVNYDAYKDTRFIEWSFLDGAHNYKWDKENGKVQVRWDNYTVNLNLNRPSKSTVKEDNTEVIGDARKDLIETATAYFNNDSFWVVAPFKVFDEGTQRSIVSLEDGSEGLLVEYSSGGSTPGDAYLWKLLPNGFPESYQMWVQIIPIGGVEATWDDWKIMESGVALPASHKMGPVTLYIKNLSAYN